MSVRKVAIFSSLALVGGYVLNELKRTRIRVGTMALSKVELKEIIDDDTIEAVVFIHEYDNRTGAKDVITLQLFLESGEQQTKVVTKRSLDLVNVDSIFDNEQGYSIYRLTKKNLKSIFDNLPPVADFILFVPENFARNKKFLSYQILPADKEFRPLSNFQNQNRIAAKSINDTQETFFSSATSSNIESNMRMNPSPPASSSFEVD